MNTNDIKKTGVKIMADKIKEKSNLALCAKAVCGDGAATIQLATEFGKTIISLPDALFYSKLTEFLNGVNFTDEDRATMSAWIAEDGTEDDNALRLVSYIDNAKSLKKVEYLGNATRCALSYGLHIELYFRICSAIDMTTEEDLKFLADNCSAATLSKGSIKPLIFISSFRMSRVSVMSYSSCKILSFSSDNFKSMKNKCNKSNNL